MITFLRRVGDDRGAATTQLVLVVPALLLIALLAVQFALVWHARHIAQHVAQRGLAAARTQDSSAADGRRQAQRTLDALASRVLIVPSVTAERTPTQTAVRVEGAVMRVVPVPGLTLHATGTASGPTERITTPTGEES